MIRKVLIEVLKKTMVVYIRKLDVKKLRPQTKVMNTKRTSIL